MLGEEAEVSFIKLKVINLTLIISKSHKAFILYSIVFSWEVSGLLLVENLWMKFNGNYVQTSVMNIIIFFSFKCWFYDFMSIMRIMSFMLNCQEKWRGFCIIIYSRKVWQFLLKAAVLFEMQIYILYFLLKENI